MPTYRDKARGCFIFEFDRIIEGQRVRTRKVLPKAWNQTQADTFDRQESARLYAVATNVERSQHSIEDAVAIYLKEKAPSLKYGDGITKELAQMYWAYRGKPLSALPDACRFYASKARKADGSTLAPATIRNRIRYLTSACRYGWKYHNMCEHDPAERVLVPQVNNERNSFASRRDMLTIAKACPCRPTRAAIRIAFYSGMRIAEIMRAVRGDSMLELADTKNGSRRHVPVHPKIRTAVKAQLRDQFWTSKQFKKAARAVDLGHLRFHDLRHSSASAMINAGVDLYTVGAVLGHKSAQSTKRYAHLATESLRGAIDKIGVKAA